MTQIQVFLGPTIGTTPAYVYLNLTAFLIILLFVLRIGSGKIAKATFVLGLGFLTSAVVPLILGIEYLWLAIFASSLLTLVGVLLFMKVYGVFDLISQKGL